MSFKRILQQKTWTQILLRPLHFSPLFAWSTSRVFDLLGLLRSTTNKKTKTPGCEQQARSLTASWGAAGCWGLPGGSLWSASASLSWWEKRQNRCSNCAASKLSDTLAAGMCSLTGKPLKSSPILRCSVDAKVSQVGTGYSLVVLGFSFSRKRQTVYCTECLHMIPSLISLWPLEMTWISIPAHL